MCNDENGVTLLELLLAVSFVSVTVAALSILLPKVSANIVNNRQRLLASNFAAADIQWIKEQYDTYDKLPLTQTGQFPVADQNINLPYNGCDCSKDMDSMQLTDATSRKTG